jgi:hypothetical protein
MTKTAVSSGGCPCLRRLGWQINFCWIPREQNEDCDALSKKDCHTAGKPSPTQRKVSKEQDRRNGLMIGKTIEGESCLCRVG